MDHARYREQLAAALASSEKGISGAFIVAVSTLAGEHGFGGDLGIKLRKLHEYYCGTDNELSVFRRELKALAALPKKELEAAAEAEPIHRTFGPLTPALVEMHCSTCEDDVPDAPDEGDKWTALYAPAYLLGWTDIPGAARSLFTLPMTVGAKLDEAALRKQTKAAIDQARLVYPALALDADDLDYRSATHFGWSLTQAMDRAAATFDRSLPGKGKGKGKAPKAGKPVPPPPMKPMEDLVYERTLKALAAWTKKNPKAELALVGFDGTPPYDNVGICFGSQATFEKTIAHLEPEATQSRKALDYKSWEYGVPYQKWLERFDVGHFDGHYVAEVKLPKYGAYARRDDAPAPKRPGGASWADGTLRVLFLRVLHRLAESGALAKVRRAPTVYLVYTLHDETPVVVHSL